MNQKRLVEQYKMLQFLLTRNDIVSEHIPHAMTRRRREFEALRQIIQAKPHLLRELPKHIHRREDAKQKSRIVSIKSRGVYRAFVDSTCGGKENGFKMAKQFLRNTLRA